MSGNDTISGGIGIDWIEGGGDDLLSGDGDADILYGQGGTDYLIGGTGDDHLVGGAGSDTFVFASASSGNDQIYDFSTAQGDRLDISHILQGYDPLSDAISDLVSDYRQRNA